MTAPVYDREGITVYHGRRAIGIEMDAVYVDIAIERLRQGVLL